MIFRSLHNAENATNLTVDDVSSTSYYSMVVDY